MTSKFGGVAVEQPVRSRFGGVQVVAPESELPQQPPQGIAGSVADMAVDSARAVPGGLAKGAAQMIGTPGSAVESAANMFPNLMDRMFPGSGKYVDAFLKFQGVAMPHLPTTREANDVFSSPTGGYYEPKTTMGKYAETIASFAPAALGPGGAGRRIANVVVPGAASEFAGQMAEGTPAEPYARAAGGLLGAGAVAAAPAVGDYAARIANRGYNAVTGQEFLDPNVEASRRMAAAVQRDGGAAAVDQGLNNWRAESNPSLLDVTGNNVRRLVRAAASGPEGDAQNLAQGYQNRVTGDLQDNAGTLARRLTPYEQRPGPIVAKDLQNTRRDLAQEQYAGPYSQPAQVTREMVSALQGPEGRRAIGRALTAASANRDTQALGELRDLLAVAAEQSGGRDPITGRMRNLQTALENLSSGSLDRVRIAMRDIGGQYARSGNDAIARGYAGRLNDLDTALDQTPGLQEARGTYRNYSNQINALELGGRANTMPHDQYAHELEALNAQAPDAARLAAGVGYRQAITDSIERPAANSTGTLNRLATGTHQGNNLTATFGPQASEAFRAGLTNEIAKVNNARFINPNTGSQTALRGDELSLVEAVPTSKGAILSKAISAIRNGLTLTATQRAAIVRMGTTEANLRDLVAQFPQHQPQQIAQQLLISAQLGNRKR